MEANVLLGALPAEERNWLRERMEVVDVRIRQPLHATGERIAWLHFPLDCAIAVFGLTGKGASTEYGLIGREGFTGLGAIFGDPSAVGNAMVVGDGACYRGSVHVMLDAFGRSEAFRRIVTRYASSRVYQLSQTSLCSMHHALRGRLSRWLLQVVDRTSSHTLHLTHDVVATALGVRREAVTLAAHRLQSGGAILCARAHIEVVDRRLLESSACECYSMLKVDTARVNREARPEPRENGSQAR
jgi:CRP-like cAMP-binding protein